MKTVKELLNTKEEKHHAVHTIRSHQTVLEALMVMGEKNVGALPVVDDGQVVGIISERDYARKMVLKGRSSVGTPVRDIMSAPVVTLEPHQRVEVWMIVMTNSHVGDMPVV